MFSALAPAMPPQQQMVYAPAIQQQPAMNMS